jgi:hypothetical protein
VYLLRAKSWRFYSLLVPFQGGEAGGVFGGGFAGLLQQQQQRFQPHTQVCHINKPQAYTGKRTSERLSNLQTWCC